MSASQLQKSKIKPSSESRELSLGEKITGGDVVVSLADVSCPICLCILVEPVEMPCLHVICKPCFQETLTHANISCPVCRARLSSWARKATKDKTLVNKTIWQYIQDKFSLEVKSRLDGEDIIDPDEILPCIPNHQFAGEGQIKTEFDAALARENEEREVFAKEEEAKSKDLINQYREEFERHRRQEIEDQEFALSVQNTPSPGKENRLQKKKNIVRGPLDLFLSSSQPISQSQGSQSLLRSPASSQSVLEKGSKISQKSKTLFSPNNITSFLMDNKVQSQPTSSLSPLAIRFSNNSEAGSQKEKNSSSPSTPNFDSTLCLELEESPLLVSNSRSRLDSTEHSPSSETYMDIAVIDLRPPFQEDSLKGEKSKNSAEPRRSNEEKKAKSYDSIQGEKSKRDMMDDKDMFENESEDIFRDEEENNKNAEERNDFTNLESDTEDAKDKNLFKPIAGPSRAYDKPQAADAAQPTISSQSLKSFLDISDDASFVEEQMKIVQQIEQEKKDMEIALKLQSQLNKESRSVDRRKGSENGYSFRATTPKSVTASNKKRRRESSDGKKDKKQMSIKDSFKRTKLSFQESEELK